MYGKISHYAVVYVASIMNIAPLADPTVHDCMCMLSVHATDHIVYMHTCKANSFKVQRSLYKNTGTSTYSTNGNIHIHVYTHVHVHIHTNFVDA